eukprot:SAG22_NODE_838_length_6910_cov_6.901189_3_plen_94_part_00
MRALADCYRDGDEQDEGLEGEAGTRDMPEAVYRKAAELGNSGAMRELADCYRTGAGVEQDEAEADRWDELAVDEDEDDDDDDDEEEEEEAAAA